MVMVRGGDGDDYDDDDVETTHHDNRHTSPTEPLKLLLEENYREQAHEYHDGTFYQEHGMLLMAKERNAKYFDTEAILWEVYFEGTSEHLELCSRGHCQFHRHPQSQVHRNRLGRLHAGNARKIKHKNLAGFSFEKAQLVTDIVF